MHRTDITNLDPINQLKDIHTHQSLRANHQNIPQRDLGSLRIRIVQHRISEGDSNERIPGHYQYDQLSRPSDMVVHEAPSVDFIQLCVSRAVEAFEQEGFDDELF